VTPLVKAAASGTTTDGDESPRIDDGS